MVKNYTTRPMTVGLTNQSEELNTEKELPRPHIIKALLNYSKSLEVKKTSDNRVIGIILN